MAGYGKICLGVGGSDKFRLREKNLVGCRKIGMVVKKLAGNGWGLKNIGRGDYSDALAPKNDVKTLRKPQFFQ